MSEDQKKQHLEKQLWKIVNKLRGKMDTDDCRDYILGFIFHKYLSREMEMYANEILQLDGLAYKSIETHKDAGLYRSH